MTTFPLNVTAQFGVPVGYLIYAIIGFFFGLILESAGFGNSRKLAAQFYFKELTVFKVMFTAIIVAMALIFFSSAIGVLDYTLIWVNPTYLWPGIIGGFVMGVGFIIGGFCPGTSLVAAATLKLDGIFFVAGALFGIFIFGDTVDFYSAFFHSSYYGRVTLPELFNLSYGVTVVAIILMALLMLWGADWVEYRFSHFPPPPKWRKPAASALATLAAITLIIGQPTLEERWQWIADQEQPRIDKREIYASPLEIAALQNDRAINIRLMDIRNEYDFNMFHIRDAVLTKHINVKMLAEELIAQPANTINVLMGNDETEATHLWKQLRAASVPNLYVLEGGVNGWLETFAPPGMLREHSLLSDTETRTPLYFDLALGSRHPMASPNPNAFSKDYVRKIKMEIKRAPAGGGCG